MTESKKTLLIEALSSHVSPAELKLILKRWETTHAAKSLYELNSFLAGMSDIPSVINNRGQIYRAIIQRLNIAEEDQPETEPHLQSADRITLSSETRLAMSRVSITVELINEILAEISFEDAQAVCREAAMSISQDRKLKAVLDWVRVFQAKLVADNKQLISARQCQSLINTFYASLCEVAGPINADRTLSASIDIVSRTHRRTEGAEQLLQELLNH